MRSLFLHIGLHKTGTTSLQKMLLDNREALLRAGLGLGPWQDPELGTHHPIIVAMERLGPERVFVEAARAPGERLLISAEDLSHVLADPRRAAAIRAAAARHFHPKVVIFLRRQDHLAESYYAEAVKTWLAGPIGDGTGFYDLDHARRIEGLEAAFGAGNVLVRLYNDGAPNDLSATLLSAVGIDPGILPSRAAPRLNVGLSRRKVLFLSRVPKPKAPDASPRALFPTRFLRRVVAESRAIADDRERFLLSPRARRALVARHLPGNRALVARFGLDPDGGFLDLPDGGAPWAPPAPIGLREAAGVLGDAYRTAWRGARRNGRLRGAFATSARLSLLLGAALTGLGGGDRLGRANRVKNAG